MINITKLPYEFVETYKAVGYPAVRPAPRIINSVDKIAIVTILPDGVIASAIEPGSIPYFELWLNYYTFLIVTDLETWSPLTFTAIVIQGILTGNTRLSNVNAVLLSILDREFIESRIGDLLGTI